MRRAGSGSHGEDGKGKGRRRKRFEERQGIVEVRGLREQKNDARVD